MYRNQYFITKSKLDTSHGLKRISFNNLHVYVHPSLDVSISKTQFIEILLIGFAIDPFEPLHTNNDIVQHLSEKCVTKQALFKEIQQLSGRFIILYKNGSDFIAFNDSCALRQLYYGFFGNDIIFTSSPRMFLDFYGDSLEISESKKEFINLKEYLDLECAWYGDKCIDNRLQKVLSNHYLDITSRKIDRIPIHLDKFYDEDTTLEYAAQVLQGSIYAITKRFKVLQTLTGGWESRMLLAASKKYKDEIKFFVFDLSDDGKNSIDTNTSKNLSNKFGLNLQIIKPQTLQETFLSAYKKEHILPKIWSRTNEIQYFFNNYSNQNIVRVSGVGGGIIKSFFGYADNNKVSARMLVHFSGYAGKSEFVQNEIESWLPGAVKYAEKYDLPLLDLFHWEQKTANWGALYAFEQDIAIEEFCPLYNRNLLVKLIKINPKKRCKPKCIFFNTLIKYLWEDLLSEPVNPASYLNNLRWIIKNNSVLDYYKIRAKISARNLLGRILMN